MNDAFRWGKSPFCGDFLKKASEKSIGVFLWPSVMQGLFGSASRTEFRILHFPFYIPHYYTTTFPALQEPQRKKRKIFGASFAFLRENDRRNFQFLPRKIELRGKNESNLKFCKKYLANFRKVLAFPRGMVYNVTYRMRCFSEIREAVPVLPDGHRFGESDSIHKRRYNHVLR